MSDIGNLRQPFERNPALDIKKVPECPITFFNDWFEITRTSAEITEPNAFVLSTASASLHVRSRTVLLKFFDSTGFVFYTNYNSEKAKDISENIRVSACFPWYPLERQVMIEGCVEKISRNESFNYFFSRPRESQIGAWVSEQSQIISSRGILMDKAQQLEEQFLGKEIPLPEFWGGYRIVPDRFEFWQGQPSRLHDRIEYRANTERHTIDDNVWIKQRLSP